MTNARGIKTITYYCGDDEREMCLFPYSEPVRRKRRGGKVKESAPKQKNLNDKNARRYFRRLVKTNFSKGDLHLTLTYSDENLPADVEAAEQEVKNFLRRVARWRKRAGLESMKYIYITEVSGRGRVHHHLLTKGDMDREVLESLWQKGWANAKKLQPSSNGLNDIIAYLSKDPKGRKRWHPSRNLKKPEMSISYSKVSMRQYNQLSLWPEDSESTKALCEKACAGFELTSFMKPYNEIVGAYYMYAELTRIHGGTENTKPKPRPKPRK